MKVKKLEEEREGDVVVGELKPDLEDEREIERSENDGSESENREKPVSAAEESDRENRSMNESNSTATARVGGDEPSQTRDDSGDHKPDPDPVNKDEEEGSVSRGSEASHSDESGTSERKWKRKNSGSENNRGGSGEIRSAGSKSQPLVGLLDLIRSHPRGSLFERRLRSQVCKYLIFLIFYYILKFIITCFLSLVLGNIKAKLEIFYILKRYSVLYMESLHFLKSYFYVHFCILLDNLYVNV